MKQAGSADKRWVGRKLTDWRARILRGEPLCRHCARKGLTTVAAEIDHIVSLEAGGTYDDSNVQPLCKACHKVKTRQDMGYRQRPEIGADGWPIASKS